MDEKHSYLVGNFQETFENFWSKFNIHWILAIFGKVVAKNKAFRNNIIFLQNFFQFRRGESLNPLTPAFSTDTCPWSKTGRQLVIKSCSYYWKYIFHDKYNLILHVFSQQRNLWQEKFKLNQLIFHRKSFCTNSKYHLFTYTYLFKSYNLGFIHTPNSLSPPNCKISALPSKPQKIWNLIFLYITQKWVSAESQFAKFPKIFFLPFLCILDLPSDKANGMFDVFLFK